MNPASKILIIDDEPNLRSTLAIILKRGGYSVDSVADAQAALQKLISERFDLVFLDLKMPGMSGMQLLPEVRLLYPDMPILILTANASLETAIEALRLGARGYLLKPLDPSQILVRLEEIFREQRKNQRVDELVNIMGEIDDSDESQKRRKA